MSAEHTTGAVRRCLARHRPHPVELAGGAARAAVAAVLRETRAGGPEMLFILRAEHDLDPWSGHMAFPGGRVDDGDDGPLAAVCRETFEEVGIDLRRSAELLGRWDDIQAMARGRWLSLVISPYAFRLTSPVVARPNEEVEEIHWVPVAGLLDPAARSTLTIEHEGRSRELPCLRVRERIIWGLTHRMLARLFAILGWERLPDPTR